MSFSEVFLNSQINISPSGNTEDLFDDYLAGRKKFQSHCWTFEGEEQVKKYASLREDVLGEDANPWSANFDRRLKECFKLILNEVRKTNQNLEFDAVLIGHGKFESFNPNCPSENINEIKNSTYYLNWIRQLISNYEISVEPNSIFMFETSCTTGATMLSIAEKQIRNRNWTRALLIAFNPLSPLMLSYLDALGVTYNGDLQDGPKVFHPGAAGFLASEAFCATVVSNKNENLEHAPLLLEAVKCYSDSNALTAIDSSGEGLSRCIRACLSAAEIRTEDISLIKAHGTGTKMNDKIEHQVVREIFKAGAEKKPMVSYKSQFGHTLNSNTLFELSLMSYSLQNDLVMPVTMSAPTEVDSPVFVPQEKIINYKMKRSLGLTMGFGGLNAAYIIKKQD